MRLIFIGDIVGRPGRRAVRELLPDLRERYRPDFVVANGENSAGGNGINREITAELLNGGIDLITMGNHVWDNKEIFDFIEAEQRLIRPANYPAGTPGRGWAVMSTRKGTKIGFINLSGRVFLPPLECPFTLAEKIITAIKQETSLILVDFHAEATSEKVAFGWHLDGKVSVVVGTHTHVQTADERILPAGTAFITDVGMTGPADSVIGVKTETILKKFMTQLPIRFETATGRSQLNAVVVDLDEATGQALAIKRVQEVIN